MEGFVSLCHMLRGRLVPVQYGNNAWDSFYNEANKEVFCFFFGSFLESIFMIYLDVFFSKS